MISRSDVYVCLFVNTLGAIHSECVSVLKNVKCLVVE